MLNKFYVRTGKRIFDLTSATCGVIFLSPVFVLAALAVKLTGPGPVLFSHKRIGLNFKPFFTHKFRTMVVGADKNGSAITTSGDARITPIGRLLRTTKLDELPQLVNVLIGDMSLVGPRPEVEQYVEMFREEYKTVLSVRPGITDYAAIEYRNEEEILQRLGGEAPEQLGSWTARRLDSGTAGQLGGGTAAQLGSEAAGRLDGQKQIGGGERRYATPQEAYVKEILPAKIALYKKYIAEQSFLTDLKIIAKTLSKVVGWTS